MNVLKDEDGQGLLEYAVVLTLFLLILAFWSWVFYSLLRSEGWWNESTPSDQQEKRTRYFGPEKPGNDFWAGSENPVSRTRVAHDERQDVVARAFPLTWERYGSSLTSNDRPHTANR